MRHLVSRIRRSRIALARNRGRRRSNFGPKCRRSTSFAAQATGQVFQVRAWGRCRPCAYRERNENKRQATIGREASSRVATVAGAQPKIGDPPAIPHPDASLMSVQVRVHVQLTHAGNALI